MNKKIIVTGAVGFIGSNLLNRLELLDYGDLIAFDWFDTNNKWKNVAKRCKTEFMNPSTMIQFIKDNNESISAIIHLGAVSSTTAIDGDEIVDTNYRLSIELFNLCKEFNIQFIYASSAATYGDGAMGFKDDEDIEYLSSLRPLNLYGWSKAQFDVYIARHHGFSSLSNQVVGLKFFNVYGPNEYHKGQQQSVIRHFYNAALENNEIKLFKSTCKDFEDGEQQRDFIYVDDCVNVIVWFLTHSNISGLYNVGTGQSTSYNQIARIISSYFDECKVSFFDMPDQLRAQYQNYTCANISKLREVGYNGNMESIKEGISKYINTYLNQQDKYK